MVKSTTELNKETDALRSRATLLPIPLRRAYYEQEAKVIRDPDTYAVLNYFFICGLHHLYLGKALAGVLCFVAFVLGVIFFPIGGFILIILVILIELPQLFMSERIVHQYNNDVSRQLLEQLERQVIRPVDGAP
jgi:TM2 domain-containing membrane protein YozV